MNKDQDKKSQNQSILQKIQKLRNIILLIQKENETIISQLYPYDNWIDTAYDSIIEFQGNPSDYEYEYESNDENYESTSEGNTDDASDKNFKQEEDDLYDDTTFNRKEKSSKHKKSSSIVNKFDRSFFTPSLFMQQNHPNISYISPNPSFPQQILQPQPQIQNVSFTNKPNELIFTPANLKRRLNEQDQMHDIISPIRPVIVQKPPLINNTQQFRPNSQFSYSQQQQNSKFIPLSMHQQPVQPNVTAPTQPQQQSQMQSHIQQQLQPQPPPQST